MRLFDSLQNLSRDAYLRLHRIDRLNAEPRFRVKFPELLAQPESALAESSHAPPFAVAHLKHLRDQLPVPDDSRHDRARANTGSPPPRAPAPAAPTSISTPSRMSSGSKTCNNNRHMKSRRHRLVLRIANHRAHMAGAQKSLHPVRGELSTASIAGGNQHVRYQQRHILQPICRACQASIAFAGAVVSNPIAKNTTCLSGFAFAIFRQSSGEYTTRTSPPCDLMLNRSHRPRHPQHVAERTENHIRAPRKLHAPYRSFSSGVTHTGHPGPFVPAQSLRSR